MRRLLLAGVATIAACTPGTLSPQRSRAARAKLSGGCKLFASPSGSDRRGHGSIRRPFRSVGRLDRALRQGQTGCLRTGTYGNTATWHRIDRNGTPTRRITITSYPGETATVNGWVDVEASYTTVSRLRIDGSNTLYRGQPGASWCPTHVSQPLVIAGRNDILEYDDYFQSDPKLRGQGIAVGFWGTADDTIIRYDRIHDVGQCMAYDHLIYLASGNNVQIYGNWMWGDRHGRGVQVYPSPTNARVFWNVIDHVGEGFVVGDEVGATVSGNQIFSNVITNATGLPWEHIRGQAITDSYGGSPGAGNVFHDNVSYKNPGGIGHTTHVRMYRNTTANPHFIDAANHDYRVRPNSRLAHWPLLAGI